MATALEDALAEGFTALLAVSGKPCVFGAASFTGVLGTLRRDDPRMLGATDHLCLLAVLATALPSPRPVLGSRLSIGGKYYKVAQSPIEQPSGVVEFVLAS